MVSAFAFLKLLIECFGFFFWFDVFVCVECKNLCLIIYGTCKPNAKDENTKLTATKTIYKPQYIYKQRSGRLMNFVVFVD